MAYWYKTLKGDGGFGKNWYETTVTRYFNTGIAGQPATYKHIYLNRSGVLSVLPGYEWDGPSGPSHDDEWNMLASLLHDAGYALLRDKGVPKKYRRVFDRLFHEMLLMAIPKMAPWWKRLALRIRARGYWLAVRIDGWRHV